MHEWPLYNQATSFFKSWRQGPIFWFLNSLSLWPSRILDLKEDLSKYIVELNWAMQSESDTIIYNSPVTYPEDPAYVPITLCLEKTKKKVEKS